MEDDRTEVLPALPSPPAGRVRVRSVTNVSPSVDRTFATAFRIGRLADCDLRLVNEYVSRSHAVVEPTPRGWTVRDLGSANGTLIDGRRITGPVILSETTEVQIGKGGPVLELSLTMPVGRASEPTPPPTERATPPRRDDAASVPRAGTEASRRGASTKRSLDDYARRYLDTADDGEPASDHTQMIRRLVANVQIRQKRRYGRIITGCAVLGLALAGFGYYQHRVAAKHANDLQRTQERVQRLFTEMKALDVQIAQIRMVVEETGQARLAEQLGALQAGRQRLASEYSGYVNDLGIYRRLTPEEQVIYRLARVFNEAEVSIPASFVRSVSNEIRTSWLSPAGQRRFRDAMERAEHEGYLKHIVDTLESYGLPPQLLYVALQESNLNPRAVGPKTRWGRAKGMWQIIPSTARRFGLDPGPTPDSGHVDQLDERHDFRKSTQAAVEYLHELYATLAQASGLLAIASYNWGEHRIIGRLDGLDGEDVDEWALFEDLPEDPASRTYWRFLTEYKSRMPDETKDYVLKIFSAAVVGENPRLFGLDMDNPIAPYTRDARAPKPSARLIRIADAEL